MSEQTVTMLRWQPEVDLGTRLRLVRQQYGLRLGHSITQEEMARVLGVKVGTYKAWEAGNSKPRSLSDFAWLVYERTGADPAWLLGVAETTTPSGTPGQVISPLAWKMQNPRVHRQLALLTAA